ncbi:MAG: hypothetical protein AAF353_00875 [Pseudomonadota bacterium]
MEDEGLCTVVVALVREHAEAMQPPRALWVPYILGRPFAEPNQPALQSRILKAALDLLDTPGSGPLLEDFIEADTTAPDESDWTFPGDIEQGDLLAEYQSISTYWEQVRDQNHGSTFGISGLSAQQAIEYLSRFFSAQPMENPKGMSKIARARFAIDDIKAFYLEAGTAGPGKPSAFQLAEWFWEQTLAGDMIREFQDQALKSDDKNLRMISGSLVPAERTNALRR